MHDTFKEQFAKLSIDEMEICIDSMQLDYEKEMPPDDLDLWQFASLISYCIDVKINRQIEAADSYIEKIFQNTLIKN